MTITQLPVETPVIITGINETSPMAALNGRTGVVVSYGKRTVTVRLSYPVTQRDVELGGFGELGLVEDLTIVGSDGYGIRVLPRRIREITEDTYAQGIAEREAQIKEVLLEIRRLAHRTKDTQIWAIARDMVDAQYINEAMPILVSEDDAVAWIRWYGQHNIFGF